MKKIFEQQGNLPNNRFIFANLIFIIFFVFLISRLWYLQIFKGEEYKSISDNNRISKIEIPAARGSFFDRNGQLILTNKIFYDLIYTPQFVKDRESTLKILSNLLQVPIESLERNLRQNRSQKRFMPLVLRKNLSNNDVSLIEANKAFLPGISVQQTPRRHYEKWIPPHLVGYLGEISKNEFAQLNEDEIARYEVGDLIGKQGLEKEWEKYLKGERGYRFVQVDALGHQVKNQTLKDLPYKPSVSGSDLNLTIDLDLQKVASQAFKGKFGAVIAMDPNNGKILAMVSEPVYNPESFQIGMNADEWRELNSDPFTPMLDKATSGLFPPGSPHKIVLAAAALEQKVVNENTTFFCPGHFSFGNRVFHCHERQGHGNVNLKRALVKSCDVYFYQVGLRLGVDTIAMYAKEFLLGSILGININNEKSGLVPTSAWFFQNFRRRWNEGETPNISIGQGLNLVTPLQLASMIATISNGGKVYKPYLVDSVSDKYGNIHFQNKPELLHQTSLIEPETYKIIQNALEAVVESEEGTGKKSRVVGVLVAGKTGTAQVVGLDRSRNITDISSKWKEHAIFVAYAPADNPKIALVVYSQNDRIGGGGASAAPVAAKIIDSYLKIENNREQSSLSNNKNPLSSKGDASSWH